MKLPYFFLTHSLLRIMRSARYRIHIAKAKANCQRRISNDFNRIFVGKHVAIVAGAPNLIGKGKGKEIDNHDVIVRFNLFHPGGREHDLGTRTDVRFVGCTLLDKHMPYAPVLMKADRIVTTMKNQVFMKGLNIPCLYYPAETPIFSLNWLTDICQGKPKPIQEKKPPRSGIVFLSMLMKYGKPARITLYGFSTSPEDSGRVIDYTGSGVSTYDPHRYLSNHCDPTIEVELLQQLKQLGKISIGA